MQRYWSQAAMLLLGITLTVGFYEGRRLVKNTAKALSAATSLSSASASRRGRDRDRDEDEDEGSYGLGAAATDQPEHERKRRRNRSSAGSEGDRESRIDKLSQLRTRQRTRLLDRPEQPVVPNIRGSHPEPLQLADPHRAELKEPIDPPALDTAVEGEEEGR